MQYPAFVQRVFDASGIDARLRLDGVFYAAFDDGGLDALRRHAHALQARGVDCDVLDRAASLAAQPWLGAALVGRALVRRRRLRR